MSAEHVAWTSDPAIATSDLIVVVLGSDDPDPVGSVTELAATLRAADIGPYAIDGLVAVAPGHDPRRVLEQMRSSAIGSTLFADLAVAEPDRVSRLQQLAAHLADVRGVAFRATSGLRVLQLAMRSAPSSTNRTDLLDRIEALQHELPVLIELGLLREIVSGRAALPSWLRNELSRLLMYSSPTQRLGLSPDADARQLRAAVESTSTGWRTMENTGRIPFSARKAMLVAQQALDRLHAELAYYG